MMRGEWFPKSLLIDTEHALNKKYTNKEVIVMKLIDCSGLDYIAHFSHFEMSDGRRATRCSLHVAPCLDSPCIGTGITGHGIAKCSSKDEFNKFTGRKIALTRALAAISLSQLDRTHLWISYLSQVSVPMRRT